MSTIRPSLWFDDKIEEAVTFYVKTFKDAEILSVARYTEAGPGPEGAILTMTFRLREQEFLAINGGPQFTFSEAISFVIDCETQEDIDYFWETLIADGGEPSECGWLKDKYGLSWQVTPTMMAKLVLDEDRERANRVMTAMLKMGKLNIATLQAAYDNE